MNVRALITMLAVGLLIVGCGDQERLESELATANTKITTLDSTLVEALVAENQVIQRADNLALTLESTQTERDNLAASLQSAENRGDRLQQEIKTARVRHERALDSLWGINSALVLDVDRWAQQLENAEITIANLEQRANRFRLERDSVYAFVDDLRPWFDYYKHESRRNWFKKLFAAGDATKPGDPEPSFESTGPSVELEAQRP